MKTLKLNNLMRNVTLIAAGAFMATLVVLPFTTSANDDDGTDHSIVASPVTYVLGASDGSSAVFALVENDGRMVLTLVERPAILNFGEDD